MRPEENETSQSAARKKKKKTINTDHLIQQNILQKDNGKIKLFQIKRN